MPWSLLKSSRSRQRAFTVFSVSLHCAISSGASAPRRLFVDPVGALYTLALLWTWRNFASSICLFPSAFLSSYRSLSFFVFSVLFFFLSPPPRFSRVRGSAQPGMTCFDQGALVHCLLFVHKSWNAGTQQQSSRASAEALFSRSRNGEGTRIRLSFIFLFFF